MLRALVILPFGQQEGHGGPCGVQLSVHTKRKGINKLQPDMSITKYLMYLFSKVGHVLCALCSDAFRQQQLQKIHPGNTAKYHTELQFHITRETQIKYNLFQARL